MFIISFYGHNIGMTDSDGDQTINDLNITRIAFLIKTYFVFGIHINDRHSILEYSDLFNDNYTV